MARRTCPVYRADVEFEQSCVPCICYDPATTGCQVIQGKVKAHADQDGKIVKEGK